MSSSELAWRSLHDLGLATWFGGSVFGSVALPHEHPAASAEWPEDSAAAQLEGESWQRFSPVLTGAMAAHLLGGAGLIAWNRGRHRHQDGVMTTTIVKSALTVAAVALTVGAAVQGTRSERLRRRAEEGDSSLALADQRERIERQMRVIGPLIPAATGALVVLGALEGEEQRPREVALGVLSSARTSVRNHLADSLHDVQGSLRDVLPDAVVHALPGAA
jgi:uncharacterized membrane protein